MADSRYTELFRFISNGLPEDTFHVLRFHGTEGLNCLFSFTLELVSTSSIDFSKVLGASAAFSIHRKDAPDAVFRGFPTRIEQGGHYNGYTYYTVELRPAFWKLTQLCQSAIFLGKSLQEVTAELLQSQKFFTFAHEFRLMRRDYPKPEFAMQYGESVYDYILWRLEEQGAYFYFAPDGDKIIFADAPQSHETAKARVVYSPATGLEGEKRDEVITSFTLSQTPLPRRVIVRSYDWKKPTRPVVGMANVSKQGLGDVYLADEHVASDAEATRIAKIRAEELICRSRIYTGAGAVPVLRPGVVFRLEQHYSDAFNREYMVTEITHEGSQEAFINLGLGISLHDVKDHLFYRNSFTCIPSDIPYRPARKAPRARISGVIRAFVDGAGSGARAELDEYGRYKLLFPFDISGRSRGNASCWVRMAGQQVGKDNGISFPLLPGAEVTVAFVDGNPDRPVITGALPNGETGAITGSGNANISGIRSPGGNQITINDTDTHQGISLQTPSGLGLTMTAGSLGSTTEHKDLGVGITSIAGTEVANMAKTLVTGCKVQSAASMQMTIVLSALTSALQNGIAGVFDSLATKAAKDNKQSKSEAYKWASDVTKTAGLTLTNLLATVRTWMAPTNHYGAALSGGENKSASMLQIWPGTGKMIALILTWLVGRAAQFTAETVDSVKESVDAKSEAETKMNDDLEKAGATKPTDDDSRKAAYTKTTKQLAKDIADALETGDAAKAAQKQAQLTNLLKDYDVLYNEDSASYYKYAKAETQRKAMVSAAKDILPEVTAIVTQLCFLGGQEKEHGGVGLASPDKNINLNAMGTTSLHSQTGIYLDTKTELEAAGTWGISQKKNYLNEAGIASWSLPRGGSVPRDSKFVSVHTHVLHHEASHILEKASISHKRANLHYLETLDGTGKFTLYKDACVLSTGDDGVIELRAGNPTAKNALLRMSKDKVSLEKGDVHLMALEDDTFALKVKDNLFTIAKDGTIGVKSSKGAKLDLTDDIILTPKSKTQIGKVTIEDSEISASVLNLNGGAIKITGGAVAALQSTIAQAARQVAQAMQQQSQQIDQLEKKLEKLSDADIKADDSKSKAVALKQKASNALVRAKLKVFGEI